jgi:hypothetical protein
LREATISTDMNVCLSVRMEQQQQQQQQQQQNSHWKDFRKILHSNVGYFRQLTDTSRFYLKSDKNNVNFTRIPTYVTISGRHLFS